MHPAGSAGSRCPPPPQGSGPRLSPLSGRPGSRVIVSGIQPHGGGEGGAPVALATGIRVWWNLDAAAWWTALRPPPRPSRPGSPVVQVAASRVAGCRYRAGLTVPAGSVPGRYRIVVLYESRTSTASLPPRWFTVPGRPAGQVALVTDAGLRIRYPAAWYGQVVAGQDALISSTPIHAPALALRETPAAGVLVSVFDIPPAQMSALRGPLPPGRCGWRTSRRATKASAPPIASPSPPAATTSSSSSPSATPSGGRRSGRRWRCCAASRPMWPLRGRGSGVTAAGERWSVGGWPLGRPTGGQARGSSRWPLGRRPDGHSSGAVATWPFGRRPLAHPATPPTSPHPRHTLSPTRHTLPATIVR